MSRDGQSRLNRTRAEGYLQPASGQATPPPRTTQLLPAAPTERLPVHPRRSLPRPLALLLTLLTLLASPAHAQATDLTWKWPPGRSTDYQARFTLDQTVSGDHPAELRWTHTIRYTESIAPAESGGVTVTRDYTGVSVEVEGHGDPARYDSTDPRTAKAADNPLIAPFARLVGQQVRITIDDTGRVTAVDGAAAALSAMFAPFAESGLGGLIPPPDPAALTRQTQAALDLIPNRTVRPGESWKPRLPLPLPAVGTLEADLTATLSRGGARTRARGSTARIDIKGSFDQPDPDGSPLANLLQLKSSAITGTIDFDPAAGQIARQRLETTSEWTTAPELLEALGQQESTQTLHQTAELTRLTP